VTQLFTCAPGLTQILGAKPTSTTQNQKLIEKVAKEFADKLGKPHTIYRHSLGLWHSYKVIQPSPESLAAKKATTKKRNDAARGITTPVESHEDIEACMENPFLEVPEEQRKKLEAYLMTFLIPEAKKLGTRSASKWLTERIPKLIND
jgi:hypothetical protein